MECEGACERHRGEVKHVHVSSPFKDWGFWNYCEEAIRDDIQYGFKVEVIEDETVAQ